MLTLRGLQLIQLADVVLYDHLVSPEVLELVRRDAEKICVGKRASAHSLPQRENRLLFTLASSGKRMVHLKGGDPFIFGGGGEEMQYLAKAGVPFQIVPGITAAVGVTAYAGIPLTHCDYAQSVLFITGHCRPDGETLDWSTLARGRQTLTIYLYGHGESGGNQPATDRPWACAGYASGGNQSWYASGSVREYRHAGAVGGFGASGSDAGIIGDWRGGCTAPSARLVWSTGAGDRANRTFCAREFGLRKGY